MNEPVTRQRPSIDLDEFERRMRQPALGDHDDDPLAELARLVGGQSDPYEDVFAHEAVAESAQTAYHEPAGASSHPPLSFAAIEAGLRGGISPQVEDHGYPASHDYEAQHAQYAGYDEQGYPLQTAPANYPTPATKSRRPVYLMAATIVLGVLGVGAAFALKGHSTNPADIKTIMADSGPTKIQPPADASGDQGQPDANILGKSQPAPTKLVSNTEEPVDVSQAVTADPAAAPATDAASIPVPPSPGEAAGTSVASADAATSPPTDGTDFAAGMPAPKKVKVISVRPDGSILPDDQASATPSAPASNATASPPADDASAPAATVPSPKSATRVMPKHAAAAAPADDDAGDTPAPTPLPKSAHKPKPKVKPQKIAMADPADPTAPDQTPTDAAASAKPVSGSFAVQLAAPGSESEARAASSKLAKKYANSLDGHHLGFFKAQSNGKSVFRVRVSSLSKDEAVSLCEKLKSNGGTCFVAKN